MASRFQRSHTRCKRKGGKAAGQPYPTEMNRPVEVRGVTRSFHPWRPIDDFHDRESARAFLQEEVDRGRKLHCCWIVENGVEVETFRVAGRTLQPETPPRLRKIT